MDVSPRWENTSASPVSAREEAWRKFNRHYKIQYNNEVPESHSANRHAQRIMVYPKPRFLQGRELTVPAGATSSLRNLQAHSCTP